MPALRRHIARAAASLVLLLLAPGSARAQAAGTRLVPSSPAPGSFIADDGPVLDPAARTRLDARIADVQRATGGDVGVAILRDLDGRAPAEVGVAIYRAWKIGTIDSLGSARRHLGALLLIVPKELSPSQRGECWITTGLGAEATLHDGDAGAICRDSVIPRLRERRYEAAVAAGVGAIGGAFAEATAGAPRTRRYRWASDGDAGSAASVGAEPMPTTMKALIVAVLLLLLLLAVLVLGGLVSALVRAVRALREHRYRLPRPCPRGHGPMPRLAGEAETDALSDGERAEERIGSVDYGVYACAHCDARVVEPNDGPRPHARCPRCAYRTLARVETTMLSATIDAEGLTAITCSCAHCGWRARQERSIPRRRAPVAASRGASFSGGAGSPSPGWSGNPSRDASRDTSGDASRASRASRGTSRFGGDGGTSGGGGGSSY